MATELILPEKRTRRSIQIPPGEHFINLISSPHGKDSNYFAVLATSGDIQVGYGGLYDDELATPNPDANPDELLDLFTVYEFGHYEAQGHLFNSSLRLWILAPLGCILIY